MRLKFLFLCLFLFSSKILFAETLNLLSIPMEDGPLFPYTVETLEKCSFRGVQKINTPKLNEKANSLNEKINKLQRELNLNILEEYIYPEFIQFSIRGAKNATFQFSFNKQNCELIKIINFGDKRYLIKSIEVDYTSPLATSVLKKMTIKTNREDLILYPWALHGNIPVYELEVGAGIEVVTNIRVKDQNTFHRTDPSYGPVGLFSFRYGPFFLNRHGAGSLLYTHKNINLLGIAILEGEKYAGENLNQRNSAIFIGTLLSINFVELTYYNDFFDNKGFVYKLNIAPKFYYDTEWRFKPAVFAQYWDDKYVDYYFGVTPTESSVSSFSAYKGTHTMNYGSTLEIMHFMGQWTHATELAAKIFGSEVYRSPTVNKKVEFKITTGLMFKFF